MIVPDLNLLLYAVFDGFPDHSRAREWWESVLSGLEPVGLVAPVLFGFLRLGTSRRVFVNPLSLEEAIGHVETWLSRPNVEYLPDTERQFQIALGLIREAGAAGSLTTDAQIAAHALAVRGVVHSHDTDFARFTGVSRHDPLGGEGP
jgi:uncharacterized protein